MADSTSPEGAAGAWATQPFYCSSLAGQPAFTFDVGVARAPNGGAYGLLGIPLPPTAAAVSGLRIVASAPGSNPAKVLIVATLRRYDAQRHGHFLVARSDLELEPGGRSDKPIEFTAVPLGADDSLTLVIQTSGKASIFHTAIRLA